MKRLFAIALCSMVLLGCKKEQGVVGDSIEYEYDSVKVTIDYGCSICLMGTDIGDNPTPVCKEWAGSFSKMKSVAKEMIQQNKQLLKPKGYLVIGSDCSQ